jgi:hypothetical protein
MSLEGHLRKSPSRLLCQLSQTADMPALGPGGSPNWAGPPARAGALGNRLDRKRRGWLLIEGLECREAAYNQK